MPLHFDNIRFLTSASAFHQCPEDLGMEVAFCGRSNAGKSSAINFLTSQQKLARISKTPGRTQLINFFSVSSRVRLVDLPGYGYAKVPDKVLKSWHHNIDEYLRNRRSLFGLVLVMDIRHPLKPFDEMILGWSNEVSIPLHILLTKSDKLKRGPASATLEQVRKSTSHLANTTVQLFSSTRKVGRDVLLQTLECWWEKSLEEDVP